MRRAFILILLLVIARSEQRGGLVPPGDSAGVLQPRKLPRNQPRPRQLWTFLPTHPQTDTSGVSFVPRVPLKRGQQQQRREEFRRERQEEIKTWPKQG